MNVRNMLMKTYFPSARTKTPHWYIVDATDQILGRLASEIARILMGKHHPIYTPHLDMGDYVIVINAAKIRTTGAKLTQKMYSRHSGYPGGFRQQSLATMLATHPDRVITEAVKGMLPKNRLGTAMLKKLRVYPGTHHEHAAQQPTALTVVGKHGHPSGPFIESLTVEQE